jgi:hypothetical protein
MRRAAVDPDHLRAPPPERSQPSQPPQYVDALRASPGRYPARMRLLGGLRAVVQAVLRRLGYVVGVVLLVLLIVAVNALLAVLLGRM